MTNAQHTINQKLQDSKILANHISKVAELVELINSCEHAGNFQAKFKAWLKKDRNWLYFSYSEAGFKRMDVNYSGGLQHGYTNTLFEISFK